MNLSEFVQDFEAVLIEGRKPMPVGTRTTRKGGTYEKQSNGKWVKVKGEKGGGSSSEKKEEPAPAKPAPSNKDDGGHDSTFRPKERGTEKQHAASDRSSSEADEATRVANKSNRFRGVARNDEVMRAQHRAATAHLLAAGDAYNAGRKKAHAHHLKLYAAHAKNAKQANPDHTGSEGGAENMRLPDKSPGRD